MQYECCVRCRVFRASRHSNTALQEILHVRELVLRSSSSEEPCDDLFEVGVAAEYRALWICKLWADEPSVAQFLEFRRSWLADLGISLDSMAMSSFWVDLLILFPGSFGLRIGRHQCIQKTGTL